MAFFKIGRTNKSMGLTGKARGGKNEGGGKSDGDRHPFRAKSESKERKEKQEIGDK